MRRVKNGAHVRVSNRVTGRLADSRQRSPNVAVDVSYEELGTTSQVVVVAGRLLARSGVWSVVRVTVLR